MSYGDLLFSTELAHARWRGMAAIDKRDRNLRIARGVGLLGMCVLGFAKHDAVSETAAEIPVIGAAVSSNAVLYPYTGLAGVLGGFELVNAGVSEYSRRQDQRVVVTTAQTGQAICEAAGVQYPSWVVDTISIEES